MHSNSTALRLARRRVAAGDCLFARYRCLQQERCRSFATETQMPARYPALAPEQPPIGSLVERQTWKASPILTTLYSFPAMEPIRFEHYPANHLGLPLRKDILQRAVIYEADKTRQGTASTKWRDEIHGSGRKLRPQKGSGRARLGDRGSPMLRGGGVAFGPKPRDFSTKLPRKIYDLAWRTALSYRYSKGQLILIENGQDIEYLETPYVKQMFERHGWGKPDGRSLIITNGRPPNLFGALREAGEDGRALHRSDVDVKDLLELGRIIIEKRALDKILKEHQSDLLG